MITDRWGSPSGSDVDLLLHRSNALGADLAVTNFGGGNTSSKTTETDPVTGKPVEVLWVKGSGGDLGTLTRDGVATLSLPALQALKARYRGPDHEDEMADLLLHAIFGRNPAPPSIDTPLHAFVRYRHVDHLHPDAVIAIAASRDGAELTKQIWGEDLVWVPYRRPGWELGLQLERVVEEHPDAKGVVLGGHGLVTWADTAEECYRTSIEVISKAAAFLDGRDNPFGEVVVQPRAHDVSLVARIRGACSTDRPVVGRFSDDPVVLDFLSRAEARRLASLGTSCPDHFIRTKVEPLFVDGPLDELHAAYRSRYETYYRAHADDDTPPMRGADPAVVLLPGVGMWTFGADAKTARLAGEYYINAINVMRGAESVSTYDPIPDAEKFRIEYWSLEEAKLRRQPAPKPLSGKVALVVGAGSGIGRATALRLAADGATIIGADLDEDAVAAVADDLGGIDHAVGIGCDVTDEASVATMIERAVLTYGGIDVVVASAGLSRSADLVDTSVEDWDVQLDVMARGSFLVAREASKALIAQGTGGDIVLIVSKNAVWAGPRNAAYGAAKAAQAHLVRLLASDLGPHGIRVNGVNPDAVVQGSGIFEGEWGDERARTYGVERDELGAFYAKRTLLGTEVLPDDVAAAVSVLVCGDLGKTTGLLIPVDGGNPQGFLR